MKQGFLLLLFFSQTFVTWPTGKEKENWEKKPNDTFIYCLFFEERNCYFPAIRKLIDGRISCNWSQICSAILSDECRSPMMFSFPRNWILFNWIHLLTKFVRYEQMTDESDWESTFSFDRFLSICPDCCSESSERRIPPMDQSQDVFGHISRETEEHRERM